MPSEPQNGQNGQNGVSRETLSVFDRLALAAIGQQRVFGLEDDKARTQFPELWNWLSATETPDRKHVIQPASLRIALTPEGVAVALYHPSYGATVEAATRHLGDAYKCIEAELRSGTPKIRLSTRKIPKPREKPKT